MSVSRDEKLRLLILTPTLPFPPDSGGDIRVFHLLRHLSSSFEIHLLSYRAGTTTGAAEHLVQQAGIAAVHDYVGGADSRNAFVSLRSLINFWHGAPHSISMQRDPSFVACLSNLISAVRFDAVLVDHLYMMQYAGMFGSLPVFYSATDVETRKFQRWYGADRVTLGRRVLHWAQTQLIQWHESRLRGRVKATFATSSADSDFLLALNRGGRFVVVPNGVDLRYFQPRSRETFDGPPAVFFVGSMFYKPNHDAATILARDIFPLVRRQLPDAVCHIVGKTGANDYSALNRPECGVMMHGSVVDIRPFLLRSQILVAPLLAGSGTRIKILEAMAAGTPVVSTTIGAEGLDYTPGKNIVIANSVEEIAATVVGLLQDRERCFEIGRNGRQLVEKSYSWEASADVMKNEINDKLADVRRDRR
jgi:glycosyltransferase involved in cell wall biosynthesis